MSSAESHANLNLAHSTEAQQTIGVIAVEEEEIERLTAKCAAMEKELAKWDVKAAITAAQLERLLEQDAKTAGETQMQRYERRGAPKPILDIIRRGGGPAMGAQMERVMRAQWPSLLPRESKKVTGRLNTGYDHRAECVVSGEWKLLEQKTSGLWSDDENDFHWQHLEVDHPWNGLLLVGIGINAIHAWGMTRESFETCVADGSATNQGNKEKNSSEGVWMTYRNVRDRLVPLLDEDDMLAFISTL